MLMLQKFKAMVIRIQVVDLAFIAEGYKADEMEKFREDVKKMADYLFAEAPFR